MGDPAAELAADNGVAVLRIALARHVADPAERPWEVHVREVMDELRWLATERNGGAGIGSDVRQ